MYEFFLSPIPLILGFLIFVGSVFIKPKLWSKGVRYFSVIVFVAAILVLLNSVNEKAVDGRLGYRAMLVKSVTYHVENLLHEGNIKEAELILQKFNEIYPTYIENDKQLEAWLKKGNIPINQYMFDEIERKMKQLKNKEE